MKISGYSDDIVMIEDAGAVMSAETPADRARMLLEGTTEGPWTADDDGVIETADGTPVGFVHRHGCIHTVRSTGEPCSLADGRLMAAAPDLARDLIASEESAQTPPQREPAQAGRATDAATDLLLQLLGEIGHAVAMGHCRDADHALRQLRADPKAPAQLLERVRALELRSRGGGEPAQVALLQQDPRHDAGQGRVSMSTCTLRTGATIELEWGDAGRAPGETGPLLNAAALWAREPGGPWVQLRCSRKTAMEYAAVADSVAELAETFP